MAYYPHEQLLLLLATLRFSVLVSRQRQYCIMMLSNPGVIDLKTSGPVASHQCPSHKLGTGRYDIAETYRFIPLRRLNWANIVFLWQTLLGVSLRVTQTLG
jgi:hypothetical protein